MKKYVLSNTLFTISFLALFAPLCFLLVNYVLDFGMSPAAAKESFSGYQSEISPVDRDFSNDGAAADQVPVLMYHQIIPERKLKDHHFNKDGSLVDMVVTLEQFTEQMEFLKANGYTVLSLHEFEGFMKEQKKVPAKSVLLTFDDGYKNVFEYAYPVLKENGFLAVQFLITGLVTDRETAYDSSVLQYVSIGELKKASDVFEYGNHTHSFHQRDDKNTAYLNAFSRSRVKEDLVKAASWLGTSKAFAAPYGEYNPGTLDILRELGVDLSFTVTPGYAAPSTQPLEVPRYGIYPFYSLDDFKYIVEMKPGGPK